jgi:radical SAM protein with 4Fe4S-binding SPASM domain
MENNAVSLSDQNNQLWRKLQIPVAPYFELTPRCTLDCKMCYVHLTPAQMGDRKELTTEQWLGLIDEAVEAGMLFAVLTGGECMLHPGFWEIYEHLLDKNVVVQINTNVVALTDEDIERFKRRQPAAFRITLYGASEEGYRRCTGNGEAFYKATANVRKLIDAEFRTAVVLTLSRYNADEFLDMVRLVRKMGFPAKYVLELTEPNDDTGRHAEEFVLSREEMLQLTKKLYLERNRPFYNNEPITELPARLPDDPNCRGVHCGAGRTSYVIHWDGLMSPCFEYHGSAYVQDVGFQAAWEATKELARQCLQPVECEDCELLKICNSCFMTRCDPKDPGHCNPERCKMTVDFYNAGLSTLKDEKRSPDDEIRENTGVDC